MTAREAVLEAFRALEQRTGRSVFKPREIVAEVTSSTTQFRESTIRTHVISQMCANAPVHHANHTDAAK